MSRLLANLLISRPAIKTAPLLIAAAPLYLIATGRWGSYIHVPGLPLFAGDSLLFLGLIALVAHDSTSPARRVRTQGGPAMAWLAVSISWGAIRFLLGNHYDLLAIRDLIPYLYLAEVPLAARLGESSEKVVIWLGRALVFHGIWSALFVFGLIPSSITSIQTGPDVGLFVIRSDFDGLVLGVACIHAFWRASRSRYRVVWLALAVCFVTACLRQPSRAALLGAALAVAIYLLSNRSQRSGVLDRLGVYARVAYGSICVMLILTFVAPASVTMGATGRLAASVGLSEAVTAQQVGAQDTQAARLSAWKLIEGDVREHEAALIGLGFGENFVSDSGASHYLGQDPAVRAPHNWLLNTYAREGLVGVSLWLAAVLAWLKRGRRAVRANEIYRGGQSASVAHSTLLLRGLTWGLLLASMLGVVLEAPFGAIPFYFAVGWAAGLTRHPSEKRQ